ncbi:hypothetical protein QBC35DRAFT_544198 [Podospora australis]|uniref:SET domain-containing protein n=1 Tax=Podospora australis TaxID=1536484 RepID=A0AAN7AET6_9PEZI|nr:hypothetical protein QBC35DRAFT_544198 [Podospora australis]
MAWSQLSLTRVLLLTLLTGAHAAENADKKAGLASEEIVKKTVYTGNATVPVLSSPPTDKWWKSKTCSGSYCVYTNLRVAKGRGIALVTKEVEFQKVERIEDHLNRADNKWEDDGSMITQTEVLEKGPGLTATKKLRRGKSLSSFSPVLLVHKDLFDDIVKKKERSRLLEAAINYLPDETREVFNKQRQRPGYPPGEKPRSIEEILYSHPFEIDLGAGYRQEHSSKHFINYPEVAAFQHDCRPNVAWYIDQNMQHRTTVARKVAEGEELAIAYIDPMMPRKRRSEWVKRHRGFGKEPKGCPCQACTHKNKPTLQRQSDKNMEEIEKIKSELRNHDSQKVTVEMIDKFIKLFEEERLNAKYAEAYELAALNYNYLGEDKKAKKYADLAVQAGIVEGGKDSNDVIAMKIMASDIKGHYSYRFTLKRRGQ